MAADVLGLEQYLHSSIQHHDAMSANLAHGNLQ